MGKNTLSLSFLAPAAVNRSDGAVAVIAGMVMRLLIPAQRARPLGAAKPARGLRASGERGGTAAPKCQTGRANVFIGRSLSWFRKSRQ